MLLPSAATLTFSGSSCANSDGLLSPTSVFFYSFLKIPHCNIVFYQTPHTANNIHNLVAGLRTFTFLVWNTLTERNTAKQEKLSFVQRGCPLSTKHLVPSNFIYMLTSTSRCYFHFKTVFSSNTFLQNKACKPPILCQKSTKVATWSVLNLSCTDATTILQRKQNRCRTRGN